MEFDVRKANEYDVPTTSTAVGSSELSPQTEGCENDGSWGINLEAMEFDVRKANEDDVPTTSTDKCPELKSLLPVESIADHVVAPDTAVSIVARTPRTVPQVKRCSTLAEIWERKGIHIKEELVFTNMPDACSDHVLIAA